MWWSRQTLIVAAHEKFIPATHASPRQIDEITREGSVQWLEGALKRSAERRRDPLKMAPDDDCHCHCCSKMQGNIRPPHNPGLIDTTLPPTRTAREGTCRLVLDPVGPVEVATPAHGLDSIVAYGDKSTSHLCISVQLYKSEAAGGRRKTKDLLAKELNFREHDDIEYTGVELALPPRTVGRSSSRMVWRTCVANGRSRI
jgi:hypothetical protein